MPGQGHGLDLDERVPKRLRSEGSARDIFCMVKALMSDDHLCQPPILVYPDSFLPATQVFFNRINSTDLVLHPSLEEGRCDELRDLAQNLEADFPHMSRGAGYLRALTNPERHCEPYPKLSFIDSGPSALNRGLGDLQLARLPPAPKPHKLKVVFHHLPRWFDVCF